MVLRSEGVFQALMQTFLYRSVRKNIVGDIKLLLI